MKGAGNVIEVPEELIGFYSRLDALQDELFAGVSLPDSMVEKNHLQQHYEEQMFWLQILKFPEVTLGFQHNLTAIAEFTKEGRPEIREKIDAIIEAITGENVEELIERTLWLDTQYFDSLANQKYLSAGLLVFLTENALRPFLRAWGQQLMKYFDKDKWQSPNCPVCGQKARISRLRQGDGSRIMFCSHCFAEWQYRHLYCPHCNNEDPMTLNIVTIEGDDIYQLFTCEKCKGYLKTINERKQPVVESMLVESARTFFLDMLAEREGYANPSMDRNELN